MPSPDRPSVIEYDNEYGPFDPSMSIRVRGLGLSMRERLGNFALGGAAGLVGSAVGTLIAHKLGITFESSAEEIIPIATSITVASGIANVYRAAGKL